MNFLQPTRLALTVLTLALIGLTGCATTSSNQSRPLDVTVTPMGPDTRLVLGDTNIILSKQVWTADDTHLKLRTGDNVDPDLRVRTQRYAFGEPGYVETRYLGEGIHQMQVGAWDLEIQELPDEFRINTGDAIVTVPKGGSVRLTDNRSVRSERHERQRRWEDVGERIDARTESRSSDVVTPRRRVRFNAPAEVGSSTITPGNTARPPASSSSSARPKVRGVVRAPQAAPSDTISDVPPPVQ